MLFGKLNQLPTELNAKGIYFVNNLEDTSQNGIYVTSKTGVHVPFILSSNKGNDGYTPYIQNNNWYINGRDTGKTAVGIKGNDGKTNYQLALDNGFIGTLNDYLISIKGEKGNPGVGTKGDNGYTPYIGDNFHWFVNDVDLGIDARGLAFNNIDDSNITSNTTFSSYKSYNTFVNKSLLGTANGIPTLDSKGLILSSFLPSYVDDVLDGSYISNVIFNDINNNPYIPESSKIYVDINTNITYRWSGTIYAMVGSSLALGETSSTAYRGDRGKIAYDHSQTEHQTIINGIGLSRFNGKVITFDNTTYEPTLGNGTSLQYLNGLKQWTNIVSQIQSDWNQSNTSLLDYIKNKPSFQSPLNGTGFIKIIGTTISYDNSNYYLASNPNAYTTNVGTVTNIAGFTLNTNGTDISTSVTNSTVSPLLTLSIPTASATNRGALSSLDWSTFNSKQSSIGFTPEQQLTFSTGLSRVGNIISNSFTAFKTVNSVSVVGNGDIYLPTFPGFGIGSGAAWGYTAHPTTISGYGITDIPTYSGTNFILNQNSSAQSANMWISGTIRSGLQILGTNATSTNYLFRWGNGTNEGFLDLSTSGATIGSSTGYLQLWTSTGNALQLNADKSATFASTVNSTGFLLNGNNLTSSLTTNNLVKWNGSSFVNSLISDDGTKVQINNNSPILELNTFSDSKKGARIFTDNDGITISAKSTYPSLRLSRSTDRGVTNVTSLSIDYDGNINIPSTTPSTSPTTGALVVSGGIGVGGNSYFGGTTTATNFIGSSDARLKNIYSSIVPQKLNIDYKEYEFKNQLGIRRFGVIAQDLLSNGYDKFVDKSSKMYGVNYIDLLISEIVYLKAKVEELERRFK